MGPIAGLQVRTTGVLVDGLVEELTPFFAVGWAAGGDNGPVHVVAECNGKVLGAARADIWRADLVDAGEPRGGFHIVFNSEVPAQSIAAVRISRSGGADTLTLAVGASVDDREPTQVFIVGSPRCGTSELADALATHLELPWLGEGQSALAPALATASAALTMPPDLKDELALAMLGEGLPMMVRTATQRIYYQAHKSASFLDKTPGEAMIRATPFLHWCFPRARFVFMRRNGIANLASRLAKFGGDFSDHCRDWTACMEAWEAARGDLAHFGPPPCTNRPVGAVRRKGADDRPLGAEGSGRAGAALRRPRALEPAQGRARRRQLSRMAD